MINAIKISGQDFDRAVADLPTAYSMHATPLALHILVSRGQTANFFTGRYRLQHQHKSLYCKR